MSVRQPASAGLTVALAVTLGAHLATGQSSGRFPESGSNSAIVIQYSMTGVTVTEKPHDNGPSMEWHRRIRGRVTGRRIGVSATVTIVNPGYPRCDQPGGGYYFTVEAKVGAGMTRKTSAHPASGKCQDAVFPTTVNLAVDVPDDAKEAMISVRATYVNPMYGNRVSLVLGEFTATPRAGAGGQGGGRSAPTYVAPTPIGGDDEGTDGTDDGIPPWVKVVGGAAAVAAGAAAIARILSSRRARKPTRPPQYGYVLQLSVHEVQVEEGKPGEFTATAWRVDEQGTPTPASSAVLTVTSPDPAIQVSPPTGTGSVTCAVRLVQPAKVPTVTLSIQAEAGGQTVQATVTVTIAALGFSAWVGGLKQVDTFFDDRSGSWHFRDVVAFFHDAEEKPRKPAFKYDFPEPPVKVEPDVLEVVKPYPDDDGLTWTFPMRLRPGADLDTHFGPLLQRFGGTIKVEVKAVAADGRPFTATVA